MGFNKAKAAAEAKVEPQKEVKQPVTKEFVPTTAKELKAIRKRAAAREAAKQKMKADRKETAKPKHARLKGDALRAAFVAGDKFHVYANNMYGVFMEFCKENGSAKPRYRAYLPTKEADGQFMFEIATALSRMNWVQLTQVIHSAVSANESPIGMATRSWSEAFRFAEHCFKLALCVEERKGMLRLTDPSVLEDWPVEPRKRKSKEDDDMNDIERRNASMKASAREDDEEEEDADAEEDGAEGDEDEEEEEEKKPVKKGKKAAKKEEPEDEEDEDEDEESEDEEEEKPVKKSAKKKKKKAAVKKPAKKEKAVKKPAKKEKAEKPEKGAAAGKLTDKTILKKVKDRSLGGPKTTLVNVVSKKGMSVKDILASAEEEGVKKAKATKWLPLMVKRGFLAVV